MPKYLCAVRPPGYATIPDGWTEYDHWFPTRRIEGFYAWRFHGWVEYPEPLDRYTAWKFDLQAVDPIERATLAFWSHDHGLKDGLMESYMGQPVEKLREYAEKRNDRKARAALVLLAEIVEPEVVLVKGQL